MTELRGLYPEIEPYDSGHLQVSDVHKIYYEQCGNKDSKQVAIILHGGPGGGCQTYYRRWLDPAAYRIILHDQRGAGRSEPHASLEENTTWDLVEDIVKLLEHLKVSDKVVVCGGSWGSTLALAFAQKHVDRVKAMILRGIFTLRREELEFFYEGKGANFLWPDAWEKFISPIPEIERHNLITAYHKRLTNDAAPDEQIRCARAWTTWEVTTCKLRVDSKAIASLDDKWAMAFARIENHYFFNYGFFERDGQLIEGARVLEEAKVPAIIVHGRYDCVCPVKNAWDLKKVWPSAQLRIIQDAGHSASEPGILDMMIRAGDIFKNN